MNEIASYALVCAALLICLSLLIAHAITGVPSLSSGARAADDAVSLLREAGLPEHAVIYELGSGWGSLALALARAFPHARVRGVEISPFPYMVSRLRALGQTNLRFEWRDFHRCALGEADAITCYLMPGKMARVAELLDAKAKPGARVVTIEFWFRGRALAATRGTAMRQAVAIYTWPTRP